MNKIILALDSFKGCLSSAEVEAAVAKGLRQAVPACEVVSLPVSDGGEGILPILVRLAEARYHEAAVAGPLGETLTARYGVANDKERTAYIELASAAGLPLVTPDRRDPLATTTRGVGQLMLHALADGCRHLVVGIGGSATNDAATGLLSALGFRFLDAEGHALTGTGASLERIASIDRSHVTPLLHGVRIEVVCDVNNPFYGPEGAACVFAPQKGAAPATVARLDDGLRSFAQVLEHTTGIDVQSLPGAGAAGGVGGGLAALLGAQLRPGIDFVLDALDFDAALAGADLVITGEGHADCQSVMGKVVSGVLRRAREGGVPVILLCGGYDDAEALCAAGLTAVYSIVPGPVALARAMEPAFASRQLCLTAMQVARTWSAAEGHPARGGE